MLISLSIPDEIYSRYMKHNPQNPTKALIEQLKRFSEISPSERIVILGKGDLAEIQRLAEASIEDAPGVVKFVQKTSQMSVGEVAVELTPTQRELADSRAKFMGMSLSEWLRPVLQTAIASHLQ